MLPGNGFAAAKPGKDAKIGLDNLVHRAAEIAAAPYAAARTALPQDLRAITDKQWQSIRFRSAKALRSGEHSPYRIELLPRGGPWPQAMTVNTIRNGIATPVPYLADLFDFGAVPKPQHLPVNFGFAGFRLMGPLNTPSRLDNLLECRGGGQFRFYGRNQVAGSICQALGVASDDAAASAVSLREVWIDSSAADADHVTFLALLDGPGATGAFQFELYPGERTSLMVTATLFARQAGAKFDLAGLSSLFMCGENDQRVRDAFRPEVHEADGLLIHGQSGEFLWRPLHNPASPLISSFAATGVKGFGLMQRDRHFSHYMSLGRAFQNCPSYWIEPVEGFDAGRIVLRETPAPDAAKANIFASFQPDADVAPGVPLRLRYRITATRNQPHVSPGGRSVNSFITPLPAPPHQPDRTALRIRVDFVGDDLSWFAQDAAMVKVNATADGADILHVSGAANPALKGYRAMVDLALPEGASVNLRIFLSAAGRTLTETWTFPLQGES
ncbi:MAG: glucan biosynthesis protein [Hyphomicrobiales bacterium]|nr:glucan biosynthesis protein [Hyphomicrobiales bacterium]